VKLEHMEEGGRGLLASENINPGQTILVALPLVHIQQPPGYSPSPKQLLPSLLNFEDCSHLSPNDTQEQDVAALRQRARLHAYEQLYSGGGSGLLQLSSINDLATLSCSPKNTAAPRSSDPQPAGTTSRSASASAAARARALLKAQLNAYAEPYQDVALASLHGHVLRAHVGIWPAHALLNHSCSPNACTLVVGGTGGDRADGEDDRAWKMVVRAARSISAGEEVTITYAGAHASSPLPVRRAALQAAFGFRCDCDRCLVEQDYHDDGSSGFGPASMTTYRELQKLRPQLADALDKGDKRAAARVADKLEELHSTSQEVLSGVEDEDDAGVLACSLQLPILELAAMLLSSSQSSHTHNGCVPQQEQQQQQQTEKAKFKSKQQSKAKGFGSFKPSPHPAQLQDTFQGLSLLTINARRLELMAQVAPASAAAVELSARQASLAEQQLDPEQVRAVQASCCELHTVRYGADVSEVDLQRLVAANKSNHGLVEALAQAEFEAA